MITALAALESKLDNLTADHAANEDILMDVLTRTEASERAVAALRTRLREAKEAKALKVLGRADSDEGTAAAAVTEAPSPRASAGEVSCVLVMLLYESSYCYLSRTSASLPEVMEAKAHKMLTPG